MSYPPRVMSSRPERLCLQRLHDPAHPGVGAPFLGEDEIETLFGPRNEIVPDDCCAAYDHADVGNAHAPTRTPTAHRGNQCRWRVEGDGDSSGGEDRDLTGREGIGVVAAVEGAPRSERPGGPTNEMTLRRAAANKNTIVGPGTAVPSERPRRQGTSYETSPSQEALGFRQRA